MYCLPDKPTSTDAIELWPILVPLIDRLELNAAELAYLQYHAQGAAIFRCAQFLTEMMVDAELDILGAIPERQAVKRTQKNQMKTCSRGVSA